MYRVHVSKYFILVNVVNNGKKTKKRKNVVCTLLSLMIIQYLLVVFNIVY